MTLFNAVRNLDDRNKQLQDIIECKNRRISRLQMDIDALRRRNEELQQEIKVKDYIIKKQVIELQKLRDVQGKVQGGEGKKLSP